MRHLDPKRKGISRRLGVDTESLSYTRKRHRNDFLLIAIYLHSARVFRLCSPSFLVSTPARKPWHVSSLTTGSSSASKILPNLEDASKIRTTFLLLDFWKKLRTLRKLEENVWRNYRVATKTDFGNYNNSIWKFFHLWPTKKMSINLIDNKRDALTVSRYNTANCIYGLNVQTLALYQSP